MGFPTVFGEDPIFIYTPARHYISEPGMIIIWISRNLKKNCCLS